MVKLTSLIALVALPALSVAQFAALQEAGNGLVRKILSGVLRFNDTQVDRVMVTKSGQDPHPYAVDLTDLNWEEVLRSGSETNPFAEKLPDDTVWVITMYGTDQVSKLFMAAFNDVATYNSSESGGSLTPEMRFARMDYGTETILSTRMWLWKVPVMVIATNNMKDLRFFKIGQIAPFHVPMSDLLAHRERWESMPIWKGEFAPGGSREWILVPLGNAWAAYHKYMSKIPSFVLLMVSGMMMNFVVGFGDKPATGNPVISDEERKNQIRARLAVLRSEAAAKEAETAEAPAPTAPVPSVEGSSAVKTGKASKRK
ncbi:hypothetical protein RQP46_004741 [Phenoliferia psychrophenolica]